MIFVNIVSYRDPELKKTITNLIDNAEHKELLRIVVFEQNDPLDQSIEGLFSSVLLLKTNAKNAKGPYWARSIVQKYYRGEEYYLQIDSHTRFIKNWDSDLKFMLFKLPEKSILTQYPPEYSIKNDKLNVNIIRSGLYVKNIGKDNFTRIQSDIISNYGLLPRYHPYTSKAWAACFSFSKGSIVKDAPYDSDIEHLFFGEEMDITVKLFSKGYEFYSPNKTIVFTTFKRDYRPFFKIDKNIQRQSIIKIKSRMKKLKLKEYLNFADITDDYHFKKTAKALRRLS